MLSPDQFETSDRLPSFTVPADRLLFDDVDLGPIDIPASYNHDGRVVLELGSFASFQHVLLPDLEVKIQIRGEQELKKFLIGRRKYSSDPENLTFEVRPSREPLVVTSSSVANSFKAVLLSPPKFIARPIELIGSDTSRFILTPFARDTREGCFISSDVKTEATNPFMPLHTIIQFMTFMKGSNCGLGNLQAFDSDGEIAYQLIGFSQNDHSVRRQTNWFDIEIQEDLPAIFHKFAKAMEDETTNKALHQTINFYRASNASREVSLEMAIIAAHSSLEAIVNFILATQAGWSKLLMGEMKVAFADKLRAAASFYRLDCNILEHSPALIAFSRARSNLDAFGIISFIRNKLVHQDSKYAPKGIELLEAWLIAQWLVEVLIFGVIGYGGKMIDRRIYNGWRGTTCAIPIG